jgi:hypothetical protein
MPSECLKFLLRHPNGRLRDEAGTSPHGRSLLPAESLQASRNKPNAVLRGNGSPLHHPACADYLVERRGLDFLTTDARC